jgi:hypothetical protein
VCGGEVGQAQKKKKEKKKEKKKNKEIAKPKHLRGLRFRMLYLFCFTSPLLIMTHLPTMNSRMHTHYATNRIITKKGNRNPSTKPNRKRKKKKPGQSKKKNPAQTKKKKKKKKPAAIVF